MPVPDLSFKLPVDAQPTDLLANRFEGWRYVIRSLITYFNEVVSVQDEIVRQQVRLNQAVYFPFFQQGVSPKAGARHSSKNPEVLHPEQIGKFFAPLGEASISEFPSQLIAFHDQQASVASTTVKELSQVVVPRLEGLHGELRRSIAEIKSYASYFNNTVSKHQQATQQALQAFEAAIDASTNASSHLQPKQDPYLHKDGLNRRIKAQVHEENGLLDSFLNLEHSGRELEIVVVEEVQHAISSFGKLMGMEAANLKHLSEQVLAGFAAKKPEFEWELFIAKNSNSFVSADLKERKLADVHYPGEDSLLASPVREGYLERRSKYLKSYSKAWYVLTPAFLHEFKSQDRSRDPLPVMSLLLDECTVSQDKSSSSSSHKFILTSTDASRKHKWVFRTESSEKLQEWLQDISTLISVTGPVARAELLAARKPKLSINTETEAALAADQVSAKNIAAAARAQAALELGSPVGSETSAVTSTGEPFNADAPDSPKVATIHETTDEATAAKKAAPAFASGIRLDSYTKTAEAKASGTAAVAVADDAADDNASVFSYDLKKKTNSTLPYDKDFKPVDSDIPISMERRLTQTNHKDDDPSAEGPGVARDRGDVDPATQLVQRRSSIASVRSKERRPSRRATGSYGGGDDLKPLSALDNNKEPGLFFADGLPQTTSSGA